MSKHEIVEPADESDALIVTVTSEFISRAVVDPMGSPRLVINYGGAALVLDAADLEHAELFGLGLAQSSLNFASRCRYLMHEFYP